MTDAERNKLLDAQQAADIAFVEGIVSGSTFSLLNPATRSLIQEMMKLAWTKGMRAGQDLAFDGVRAIHDKVRGGK